MHGSAGLHSAMAIKRQRRIREQAKKRAARERRLSSQTSSIDSVEHLPTAKHLPNNSPANQHLATSIGMLHLGVCFLVLGLFLIGSGLLPDDMVTWRSGGWWNELLATGLFVATLGVFLISLNRVMSRMEEDNLNEYVQRQLTRSRSGHRLERDVETGCLTTKNHRRLLEKKREDKERGLLAEEDIIPQVHHHTTTTSTTTVDPVQNGEVQLEKILEEDVFDKSNDDLSNKRADYDYCNRETMSNTTTASLSPDGTPSESKELLSNGKYYTKIY